LSTVTSFIATPESLELRDGSGAVVTRLDYRSDAAPAIATLETVLGAAPVSEEYQGSNEHAPSTAHRWGGFELWEQHYDGWEDAVMPPPTVRLPAYRPRSHHLIRVVSRSSPPMAIASAIHDRGARRA
jgi:hypothetical protein